jgi:hypothetical protein
VPVAHVCNPSYSGSRDQEDPGSKPAWANSWQDPILKKAHQREGLAEWLKVKAQSSSPSTETPPQKTNQPNNNNKTPFEIAV